MNAGKVVNTSMGRFHSGWFWFASTICKEMEQYKYLRN